MNQLLNVCQKGTLKIINKLTASFHLVLKAY